MPYVVGLTGGIGSGKTTVAELFDDHGAGVIDTDAISHGLTTSGGAAVDEIRRRFGSEFIAADGALDRARMRKLVFADAEARATLESILHPIIRAETRRQVAELASPYAIIVVPLLVESSSYRGFAQRVAVVDCDPELQVQRVMKRSGISREEVLAIIGTQASREQRLQAADDVIRNDGGLARLREQVAPLHELYRQLAIGE